MDSRRQALSFCLNAAVIVVVQVVNELLLEVFHRLELLQIEQFTFQQAKEVFYYLIIQAVSFAAHTLLDAFRFQHSLVLFVLVLPALVRVENQPCPVRYYFKSLMIDSLPDKLIFQLHKAM